MGEYIFPVGTLVKVEMEVAIPVAATETQIEEWLRYEFHDNGSLKNGNPLMDKQPEPFGWSFDCAVTDRRGREERFNQVIKADGSTHCSVRYVREPLSAVAQATATPQDSTGVDTTQASQEQGA